MKLNNITIENFHCFSNDTFNLADKVTVIIGKNGCGKSSLINAIKNSLSFIFTNSEATWGYPSLSGTVSELKVANIRLREVWHDMQMKPSSFVNLTATATYNGMDLPTWSLYKIARQKAQVQPTKYKDAYMAFMDRYQSCDRLPLLVYYSDRFPHINTNLGSNVKEMLENDVLVDRSWGYYHWDEFTSCSEIWQKRFIRVSTLLRGLKDSLEDTPQENIEYRNSLTAQIESMVQELKYVKDCIRRFSSSEIDNLSDQSDSFQVNDIIVDGIEDKYLVVLSNDGSRRRWDELPAGYERLYNIVFDMAYRSYILNRGAFSPSGIVMIDEVDLHLHPSLAQDVIIRLTAAFKDVQFIVTTHSPLVISNFESKNGGCIIHMQRVNGEYKHTYVDDLYGMDYDTILSSVMQTETSNIYFRLLCDKYVRLMRRQKIEAAENVLQEISESVSEKRLEDIKVELSRRISE